MKNLIRTVIAVLAIGLLAVGIGFATASPRVMSDFAIAATGPHGMGTVRADLGGCFIALSLFTLFGLRRGQAKWLLVPLQFLGIILLLRLLHLGVDGVTSAGLRSTVIEIVLLALLWGGRRILTNDAQPTR